MADFNIDYDIQYILIFLCKPAQNFMVFAPEMSTDRTGSDWIRTDANFGRIRTGSDCNFFENWRIRTGSD